MSRSVLIVESKNDKVFIEAVVKHLNIQNVNIDEPICLGNEDFICLDGTDVNPQKPTLLIRKLNDIKTDIIKKDIAKIGILIDLDSNSKSDRLKMINTALENVFGFQLPKIEDENKFISINCDGQIVQISCYFTKVDQGGELETLLKEIATKDSRHANCLTAWKDCLASKGTTISDKDFDKFWITNYIRFDTCTAEEKKQAGRFCTMGGEGFSYIMTNKPDIFDLNSERIRELRVFIMMF